MVRIAAADRAGRERLRYRAGPLFVLDRLRELEPERLLYESTEACCGRERPAAADATGATRPPRRAGAAAADPLSSLHRHAGAAPTSALGRHALARAATTSPPAPKAQPAAEPTHRRADRYASRRLAQVKPCYATLDGASRRWIYSPLVAHTTNGSRPK